MITAGMSMMLIPADFFDRGYRNYRSHRDYKSYRSYSLAEYCVRSFT